VQLQQVSQLDEKHRLIGAQVDNMCLKYWGPYRALTKGDAIIAAVAWHTPSVDVVKLLSLYEGYAYSDHWMTIKFETRDEVYGRALCSTATIWSVGLQTNWSRVSNSA
jgi:hypothetical protein